jgi:two-component system, chemotaxis family, protein-glutamate methylesterase/glutaminase
MGVIKVLIVDDSAFVRRTYKNLLESDPEIVVIGTAGDPYIAVQKIQREKPDVITLDIEMPRMDGLTFLKKLMAQAPMPVVVISNQSVKGADVALKALEMGAVDVMAKPSLATEEEVAESSINLVDKVRSAFYATAKKELVAKDWKTKIPQRKIFSPSSTVIAVGASTGGTEAIKRFLEVLPSKMPPILIVQHMPDKFTASFAKRLNDHCALTVKEAEDNEPILPDTVYIAPGSKHMAMHVHQGRDCIKVFHAELVNRHRPSVNVLFTSVAEIKGKHAIGIIMTGMGDDGATGMLAMYNKGAYTIAQDEASSVVFGMPHRAITAGGVSRVLSISDIPKEVCELLAK